MSTTPDEVLAFWLDRTGPKGWYAVDPDLDDRVTETFHDAWSRAAQGAHALWLTHPTGVLAYVILTDQFPRNMFRGEGRAFSTDPIALAAAKSAIARGWDMAIDEPARQFFYLPLMHSESTADQDRCVRLVLGRMPRTGADTLVHAKAHREVIRRFGRFPTRNEALGRPTQPAEAEFLASGGYGAAVRAVRAA